MAEDKKDNTGGIPNLYWRYIATFLLVSVVIYLWDRFFSTNAPAFRTINYSQFMEQLNAGNIKSVSIKKELVTGEFVKEVECPVAGRKETRAGEILSDRPAFFPG